MNLCVRALCLVTLEVIGEFRRGVGVAAAPGLVVDDLALEAIVVVDAMQQPDVGMRVAVFFAILEVSF